MNIFLSRAKFACILAALWCGGAFPGAANSQETGSGLPFLKMGAGADAIARGDAMTASAAGAQALFYNPAGLARADESSLLVMHDQNVLGITNDILGSAVVLGDWSLGIGLQAESVNGIQIRDVASASPLGTFSSLDGALTGGAALKLSDEVSIGLNLKALIEKIYINDAFGAAMDFGAIYAPANTHFTYGLALQNIGAMGVLNNEAVEVPTLIRAGGAYSDMLGAAQELLSYTASLDVEKTFADNGIHICGGVEAAYKNTFFLRAGYATGYDASGFSAGVGVKYHFLQFDYALTPYSQNYGAANTLSVKFAL